MASVYDTFAQNANPFDKPCLQFLEANVVEQQIAIIQELNKKPVKRRLWIKRWRWCCFCLNPFVLMFAFVVDRWALVSAGLLYLAWSSFIAEHILRIVIYKTEHASDAGTAFGWTVLATLITTVFNVLIVYLPIVFAKCKTERQSRNRALYNMLIAIIQPFFPKWIPNTWAYDSDEDPLVELGVTLPDARGLLKKDPVATAGFERRKR